VRWGRAPHVRVLAPAREDGARARETCYADAMHQNKSTIERAFELARGGQCHTVDEIRRSLMREGYESVQSHLSGPSVTRQMKEAILAARSPQGGQ